jgi:hypothetical protein
MSHILKGILFVTAVIIGFNACSSSQKTTGTSSKTNAKYPAWYSTSDFTSDSLSFYGYAKAVSSDSIVAVANAELQARANLESALAGKLETVRSKIEEVGESVATRADFILTLRNAHQEVQGAAQKVKGEARDTDGYFTGYTQVSISKSDFNSVLKNGFKGKKSYWKTLSSSSA